MTYKTFEYFGDTKETIERNATTQEIANLEKRDAKLQLIEDKKLAKAEQKAALLDRLGITAEEAALLLS